MNSDEQPPVPPPNIQLREIEALVTELLTREVPRLVQRVLHPSPDPNLDMDQGINEDQLGNLSSLDKVPDIVKSLREFSGQAAEYSSWRKSVERVLQIYAAERGSPKYFGILSVIRNKIVGQADAVLESYNTPLNWERISRCLTLHYADKRDLQTLEYQMTCLIQGNDTIPQFYQAVYHHLSLILNKISSMEMGVEARNILVSSYRDKALDTFVRGLRGDLPKLLSVREPTDLPQALHLCHKLDNVNYRTQHANNTSNFMRRMNGNPPPPIPPRQKPIPAPRHTFYPELFNQQPTRADHPPVQQNAYYSRQSFPYQQPNQNYPYRQQYQAPAQYRQSPPRLFPKPPQRPEPMEVDRSLRSRMVDYQNRPHNRPAQLLPKRPTHPPLQYPNKQQRMFHTMDLTETSQAQYEDALRNCDEGHEETLTDYIATEESGTLVQDTSQEPDIYTTENVEVNNDFQDIHFLE